MLTTARSPEQGRAFFTFYISISEKKPIILFNQQRGQRNRALPNWKEGKGGESSWSHMLLPFLLAATTVLPTSEDRKAEGDTPSMTFGSSATTALLIFWPTQWSSTALLAASTSGSSGIAAPCAPARAPFSRAFRSASLAQLTTEIREGRSGKKQ